LRIRNLGGLLLTDVVAHVRSLDPLVSVEDSIVDFGTIHVGRVSGVPASPFSRLQADDFSGRHEFPLKVRLSSAQTADLDTTILVPAAAAFSLQGRVLDGDGNPLGGTWIRVGGPRLYTLVSDAEGFYSGDLIPGEYTFNITPLPPFVPEFRVVPIYENTRLDLILEAGVNFSGTVVDTAGLPVREARVHLHMQSVATGTDGRFLIFAPRGTFRLEIRPPPGAMLPTLHRQITIDGDKDWRFTLTPGLSVRLRIVGDGHTSLPGYSYLIGEAGSDVSEADSNGVSTHFVGAGIFRFDLPIRLMETGYSTIFRVVSDTALSIRPPAKGDVQGLLVDRSVIPGLSPSLDFRSASAPVQASATVSASGGFRALLQRGSYSVRLGGDTGSAPGQILDTIEVRGSIDGVEFLPRDGELFQGRLLTENGSPTQPAHILFSSVESRAWTHASPETDGAFEAFALPGTYTPSVLVDSNMYRLESVSLPGNVTVRLPGGTVTGHLESPPAPDEPPALVAIVDDPLSLFVLRYVSRARAYMLMSADPASAALVGSHGTFAIAGPRRYLVALPSRGSGAGTLIDLTGEPVASPGLRVSWPTAPRDTLFGAVTARFDANVSGAVLRLYEARTGVIAQTSIFLNSGGYILDLPPGAYRARIGLVDPHLGFLQQFDLGTVVVAGNRRWDIELSDAATLVSEAETHALPAGPELAQNFPNPFNAATVIRFRLPGEGEVRLELFDILGQRIATLVRAPLSGGPHAAGWNGRDDYGRPVSSGVYFYRLRFGSTRLTHKLLLLR
jgi:hypothetical protein